MRWASLAIRRGFPVHGHHVPRRPAAPSMYDGAVLMPGRLYL